MQTVSWPQNEGMLDGEANTGNDIPPLHLHIVVDVDKCISVAVKDRAVDNAR